MDIINMLEDKGVTIPNDFECGKIYFGRCKWFNSKNGYGFITLKNAEQKEYDIFVHHHSIRVSNEQYKYLILGEYVQFKIITTNNTKHKYYADDICGINGGKLMCETQKEFRDSRIKHKVSKSETLEKSPEKQLIDDVDVDTDTQKWSVASSGKAKKEKKNKK
jgi:cold shock CspA family protein